MESDFGSIGMISWKNQHMSVDRWQIDRGSCRQLVTVFIDRFRFQDLYASASVEMVEGHRWLVRLDDYDYILHGSIICESMDIAKVSGGCLGPAAENFIDSLLLTFNIPNDYLRKLRISEAKAMARNGNDLFLDLLPLAELDKRSNGFDHRFTIKTPDIS